MKIEDKTADETVGKAKRIGESKTPINLYQEETEAKKPTVERAVPDMFKYFGNNSDGEMVFNTLHLRNAPKHEALSLGRNEVLEVSWIDEFDTEVFRTEEDWSNPNKIAYALRHIRENTEVRLFYSSGELILTNTTDELEARMERKYTLPQYMDEHDIPFGSPIKVRTVFPNKETPVDARLREINKELVDTGSYSRVYLIDMGKRAERRAEEEDNEL